MTSTATTSREPISASTKQQDADAEDYVPMVAPYDSVSHQQAEQQEPFKRSILKALTWRLVTTLVTIIISLFITADVRTALHVGFFEFMAKLVPEFVLYVLHERLWLRIKL